MRAWQFSHPEHIDPARVGRRILPMGSQDPAEDIGSMNGAAIEHRAAKGSLVNGLSTILTIGFQLVSVPVCIHYWGKESYGSWLALFSAFMLLRSLDGGFTVFVGNKLNYLYHQNAAALHEHLSSAVFGIVVISCVELALVAGT